MLALDGVGVGVRYHEISSCCSDIVGFGLFWGHTAARLRRGNEEHVRMRESRGGEEINAHAGSAFPSTAHIQSLARRHTAYPLTGRRRGRKREKNHGRMVSRREVRRWRLNGVDRKMSLSRGSLVWVESLLLSSHPKRYFVGSRAIGSKTGQCGTFCGGLSSEQMRVPFFHVSVGDRSFHARPGD